MATTEGLRKTEVRIGIGVIATLSALLVVVFVLRLVGVRFTGEDPWPNPVVSREPFAPKPSGATGPPPTRSDQPTELQARAGFDPPPYGASDGRSDWSGANVVPRPRPAVEPEPPDYVPRLAGLLHQRDPVTSSAASQRSSLDEGQKRLPTGVTEPHGGHGEANASASDRPVVGERRGDDAAAGTTTLQESAAERATRGARPRTDGQRPSEASVAPLERAVESSSNLGERYTRSRPARQSGPDANPDGQRPEPTSASARARPATERVGLGGRPAPVILRSPKKSSAQADIKSGADRRRSYIVQRGDTLFDIARAALGDGSRWPEIFRLNREILDDDYNRLHPGTRLHVPGGDDHAVSLKREPVRILR